MTSSAPRSTSNAVRSRTSAGHAATIAGAPIKPGFPSSRRTIRLRLTTDERPVVTLTRSVVFRSEEFRFSQRDRQQYEAGNEDHQYQPQSPDASMLGGDHLHAALQDQTGTGQKIGAHGNGSFLKPRGLMNHVMPARCSRVLTIMRTPTVIPKTPVTTPASWRLMSVLSSVGWPAVTDAGHAGQAEHPVSRWCWPLSPGRLARVRPGRTFIAAFRAVSPAPHLMPRAW